MLVYRAAETGDNWLSFPIKNLVYLRLNFVKFLQVSIIIVKRFEIFSNDF